MLIKIKNPRDWIENLAEAIGIPIINHTLIIPDKLGEGIIQSIPLSKGLHITIKKLLLKETIIIEKKQWENCLVQPIIFHYSDSGVRQWVNGENILLGRNTPNGIIVPSHQITTKIYLPKNIKIVVMAVVFTKEWFFNYFEEGFQEDVNQEASLRNLFFIDRPYFIYESVTPQIMRVMEDILNVEYPENLARMYLQGKVMEILALLFHKLIMREQVAPVGNLNTDYVEVLLEAERILKNNLSKPLTISELSKQIGVSESKLKKGFKEIFGQSIYQYILQYRMSQAKSLLDTRRYNVTEVGTQLGYSNLAHFAKAFRKQFNISPSSYLASIRN